MAASKKRVEYIDAMRGFTMLMVVMPHITLWSFMEKDNYGYNGFIEVFRMPLFFFISGWVFYKVDRAWTMSSVISVLQRKFAVQIIPSVTFLLLFLYLFETITIDHLGNDKAGYWFTFVLFEFFVINVFAEKLLNKNNLAKKEIWVGTVMVAISVLSFYYAKYYTQYASELGLWKGILGFLSFTKFKYIVFFWLGTIVKRFFAGFIKLTDNKHVMAGMILLFFIIVLDPHVDSVMGEYFIFLLLGFAGICVVFTFFRKNESHFSKDRALGRISQLVGRRTLDIYLLHYFFLPHNLEFIGTFLKQYDNRAIDVLIMLPLAVWIMAICLIVSKIIRLSPFLEHYLFGVQNKNM